MTNVEIHGLIGFGIMLIGLLAFPATAAYADWKLDHKQPAVK